MPIYTPRGLKLGLSIPYAFGLMARLHPRVTPFRVLITTEAIRDLPSAFSYMAGIVCFLMAASPGTVFFIVLSSYLLMTLVNTRGFNNHPVLIWVGTLYSYVAGRGILLVLLLLLGYGRAGWQGVVGFFLAKLVGFGIRIFLERRVEDKLHDEMGHFLTFSEVAFLHAYIHHACALGVTTDLTVSEEEMLETHWEPALKHLAIGWPQVVARFTPD